MYNWIRVWHTLSMSDYHLGAKRWKVSNEKQRRISIKTNNESWFKILHSNSSVQLLKIAYASRALFFPWYSYTMPNKHPSIFPTIINNNKNNTAEAKTRIIQHSHNNTLEKCPEDAEPKCNVIFFKFRYVGRHTSWY